MFLTIGPASGGRQRSGKNVGNTGNHSGKPPLVCAATVDFDGKRLDQPQTAGNCRKNACTTPSTIRENYIRFGAAMVELDRNRLG